ncbi:unnamed protein product [Candidula unifasciata]|uniref:C2H2-type domain-containing protein n=1 Tax=Candidula unifasciata TaxID=100452 RepID=A0A8S3ZCR9_9EUPU|nr:unnamed protein product [Candidula unifasciata]
MRTKVDKNPKTTVEQKHNIRSASPKVVLNANDCARLLDGTGKTYVLLVEKNGKMVAANSRSPVQSSPATTSLDPASVESSEPVVSSSLTDVGDAAAVATSQTQSCKNVVSVSSNECSKPADGCKLIEYSKAFDCSNLAECRIPADCSEFTECRKPDDGKLAGISDTVPVEKLTINNPQTSHSLEKSTHSKIILKPPKKRRGLLKKFENAASEALALDTMTKSAVTSVGVAPDVCSGQTDASLSLPLNSSLDGARKHSIEHLLWHQPTSSVSTASQSLISGNFSCESPTLILPQNDLQSSLINTALFNLSTSSPSISNSFPEAQCRISELYSHPYSSAHHAIGSHALSCQTSVPEVRVTTREHSPSLSHLDLLSANQITAKPACFHHLPEQVEPMNLSTSCKSQIHSTTGLDFQNSEDNLEVCSLQESQSVGISEGRVPEAVLKTHEDISVMNQSETLADVPQTVLPHTNLSSGILNANHSAHNSAIVLATLAEKEACSVSGQPNSPAVSQRLSDSDLLPSNLQSQITAEAACQDIETKGCSLLDQLPASTVKYSHSSRSESSMPENSSSLDCQACDVQKSTTGSLHTCQESVFLEKESASKTKRSPKKRVETPMDDRSRDERTTRYSLTIDDVIANFVYVPEPLEEFSLTEEEEAAIRDQFQDIPEVRSKVHTDINANQSKHDQLANNTDTLDQPDLGITSEKLSTSNGTLNLVASCPKIIAATDGTTNECQEGHSTVKNIDSVLAFVAGDVFNSVSLVSVIKNADTKKQTKSIRKLKKVEAGNKNGKENKILTSGDVLAGEVSLCITNIKQDFSSAEGHRPGPDVLVSDSVSDNGQLAQDTIVISKPRKPKKKKSVGMCGKPPELVQPDAEDTSAETEAKDGLSQAADVLLTARKDTKGSLRASKTRKSSGRGAVFASAIAGQSDVANAGQSDVAADKDIVSLSRAETSDIGESLASTSGGSEQDTPVHELELKDELVSANLQPAENRDTGLESDEDSGKPVRRYKKRLDFVKCDHCDHQSRGRSALSRHMKKVHMLDISMPYRCQHCDYGCTKMASLNRHLFTHGVFPCSRCSHVADDRIKLTQHVIEDHRDKLNMKLCKMCNRYIKCDQVTIEQHSQQCQGPTPFRCTECDKVFRYASSLRVHYHTHFPNQPKRFRCEQCDYSTNYKANLHKHQKNMHACRDRDVQCPDCNKLFSTHDNMRRHRKVHTLVRPFACQTCEKTFKTQGALRGHQLIHTAIRPYMCNITGCNRSFRTSKFMKNHQEEFHRLAPKKFFCPVEGCNYSFFKRSHLKRHAITHTGERNFHCTWPGCSKSFRHSDNLKVHFRAHTNDKPVRCHMCDFKCKQLNSLFWHKKKVHHVFDIMAYPKRTDHKLTEATNALKTATPEVDCSHATLRIAGLEPEDEGNSQILPATEASESEVVGGQVAFIAVNSESSKCQNETVPLIFEKATLTVGVEASDVAAENPAGVLPETEVKDSLFTRTEETKLVPCDQSVGTQTATREPDLLDLYEFKSDDESDEETPGQFRRDKNMLTVLTPLPPPPKELLHRIELQEMKEKEKREKAEQKEQEKKERAEKKDQERKERIEKKELEKKEKAERKEIEKIERIRKKELEKLEKLEKKELEKKEKEEQKLSEMKEKIEKKEMEKKDKVGKKELEKKEKLEKKEQAKKEKLERKEQERREKIEKKEQEMKQKQGKHEQGKKGKEKQAEINKATTDNLKNVGKKKNTVGNRMAGKEQLTDDTAIEKSPKRLQRNKSPVAATMSSSLVRSEMHTRSKRKLTTINSDVSKAETDSRRPGDSQDVGISTPKRRKVATRKMEESAPVLSPRAAAVGKATTAIRKNAPAEVKKRDKLPLPKRKPSARIKAKKKATVKEVRKIPKASKLILRNQPGRKKLVSQVKEIVQEKQEKKTEVKAKVEDGAAVTVSEEKEVAATEVHEEAVILPQKPLSPAYSEEMMLQGSASPYRGLSDGENLEDDETEVEETQDQSPGTLLPQEQSHARSKSEADNDLLSSDKVDSFAMDRNVSQTVDDYSDNEVSIDIPLTPPRAPAPPPVESSEDEMEPEPEPTPTPFSVPGPTTPFSVPAPNTPFSVPPPTNLMQQHSVHSDEATVSALPSVASMEVHSQASVDMQQPLGSVEMHPHGSVEMSHPHGSAEMLHPHGSVEMNHPHGSVEINHPHGSVEMCHPHGSVEMNHLHGSVEMHHSQGSVEMSLPHGSVEMVQSMNSLEGQHPHRTVSECMTHSEQTLSSIRTPESVIRDSNSNSLSEKYDLLPHSLQEQVQTSDADKEYFDQYLKSLSAANNRAANGGLGPSPSGLQQLEAMVCKSHLLDSREINSKSPISSLPISVITSLENSLSLLPHGDLRTRMDALVSDRHESLYARDTPSSLARLPDHQIPLANHPCPTPSYDTFSPLTPLHPSASNSGRDSSYLRQPEKLFPTPPGSSSFMAEAMFQRQAMTTPFLPPHSDKSSLSRAPDTTHLRSSSSSSLLRRPGTIPASDMFSSPAMTQAVPRHPFANTWAGQEMRPTHWQPPYLPRQPNINFMFDPSIRPAADRNMFSSLSTQSQDSFQLDRFDLSNYFPNAKTPYGSSTGSFDYSRSVHTSATKPFDDRYRQTSTSAAISDFRGLPSTSGSADMFPGLPSVNSSFNIYSGSPMGYHPQHMPDNVNSAFLAHPATSQHAMFERDYASTAHRGLYPQNTPYSFLDERQYAGASKLAHTHPVAPAAVPQERNIMSRSAAADSQMQDPYRSMLYRY